MARNPTVTVPKILCGSVLLQSCPPCILHKELVRGGRPGQREGGQVAAGKAQEGALHARTITTGASGCGREVCKLELDRTKQTGHTGVQGVQAYPLRSLPPRLLLHPAL